MNHRSDHPSRHQPRLQAHAHLGPGSRHPARGRSQLPVRAPALVIECDDCIMQHSSACDDCLVTFVLSGDDRSRAPSPADPAPEVLVLEPAEVLAVDRLARAGLVPALRHEVAVP